MTAPDASTTPNAAFAPDASTPPNAAAAPDASTPPNAAAAPDVAARSDAPAVRAASGGTPAVAARPGVPTATLLRAGTIAGPLLVTVTVAQAATRDGFDLAQHPLSLLSLGEFGWIHITNFVVSGLLFLAGSVGLRRILRAGPASAWGPRLIAIFGVSLVWAGVFVADPYRGFPVGASEPAQMSWHGALHAVAPVVAGLSLVIAGFVFARRFARFGHRGWATSSAIVALTSFGLTNAAIALDDYRVMAVGGAIAWLWASAVIARLEREQ